MRGRNATVVLSQQANKSGLSKSSLHFLDALLSLLSACMFRIHKIENRACKNTARNIVAGSIVANQNMGTGM
jgi:hypothetical protein